MRTSHYLPAYGRIPNDPMHGARSGIVHAALSFATAFAAKGAQVSITGWREGSPQRHQSSHGLEIRTHPGYQFARGGRWDLRWLLPMTVHSYRQPRPEVLHVYSDPNLLRLRGRRRILHLQNCPANGVSASYLRLLNLADAVVCCSDYIRDQFLWHTRWNAERTFTVHNGTNPCHFRPVDERETACARRRHGFGDEDVVVLYAGAVVPEKGVLALARAFHKVKPHVSNATLVIAGGRLWAGLASDAMGSGDDYEKEVARAVPRGTRILGPVRHETLPDLYRAADILVVPSEWDEPFGMVALDGSASGLPVIATRSGGLPEIIREGQTGLLVPKQDEDSLAHAIIRLARDRALRQQLGCAGRERSLEFSWELMARRLAIVYDSSINEPRD